MYEADKREFPGGYAVTVYYDPEPQSPREWSSIGAMVCWHRRYDLGDEQVKSSSHFEVECERCGGTGTDPDKESDNCHACEGYGAIDNGPIEWAKKTRGARVVVPLGLIDHSGLGMYAGGGAHICDPGGWDSGTVGIIFDTPEGLKGSWGDSASELTDERIRELLIGEIQTYDNYLRGNVYGYVISTPDDDHADSCWGYYPDNDLPRGVDEWQYCMDEGISVLKSMHPHLDIPNRESGEKGVLTSVDVDV